MPSNAELLSILAATQALNICLNANKKLRDVIENWFNDFWGFKSPVSIKQPVWGRGLNPRHQT